MFYRDYRRNVFSKRVRRSALRALTHAPIDCIPSKIMLCKKNLSAFCLRTLLRSGLGLKMHGSKCIGRCDALLRVHRGSGGRSCRLRAGCFQTIDVVVFVLFSFLFSSPAGLTNRPLSRSNKSSAPQLAPAAGVSGGLLARTPIAIGGARARAVLSARVRLHESSDRRRPRLSSRSGQIVCSFRPLSAGRLGRASCVRTDHHRWCARACSSLCSYPSPRAGCLGFEHFRPPLPRMLKCLPFPSAGGFWEAGVPRPSSRSAARMEIVAVDGSLLTDNSASFHHVVMFSSLPIRPCSGGGWDFARRQVLVLAVDASTLHLPSDTPSLALVLRLNRRRAQVSRATAMA
jgi:hypothetical protein